MLLCACMHACMCACMRACVRACMHCVCFSFVVVYCSFFAVVLSFLTLSGFWSHLKLATPRTNPLLIWHGGVGGGSWEPTPTGLGGCRVEWDKPHCPRSPDHGTKTSVGPCPENVTLDPAEAPPPPPPSLPPSLHPTLFTTRGQRTLRSTTREDPRILTSGDA